MGEVKRYIAVDLGAESGRVMFGDVSADKLWLQEVHRFTNGPIEEDGSLRWDFEKLFSEIKTGLAKAIKQSDAEISGIGVDSWGVDFGLLNQNGQLLENPYHYRDHRTDGMMEKAFRRMEKRDIYEETGLQFLQFNTLYQLLSMNLSKSPILSKARKLVFMADMVSYRLCGCPFAEYSLASTSQLMDMRTGRWSKNIFKNFGLSTDIMPEVVKAGTIAGKLKTELCQEFKCNPINIIAVGSHDTASAVAAVPAEHDHWAYLSCGTWSLMGVELTEPIINDKTFEYQFTNEGGVENTIRLLKNIMGLWLVQECKRQWQKDGVELSYGELTEMARKAKPFVAYVNPDDSRFLAPGNMPARINAYLAETGQKQLKNKGQMIRTILESLALKYRSVIEAIENITAHRLDVLHIVGGGIQNELLCQFAANAIAKKVIAGPIEATASGNILMQAKAAGQIKTLSQVREIVGNSFSLKEYEVQDVPLWQNQYERIQK